MLINGKWDADWHPVQNKDSDGRFVRQKSTFRDWVTPDGSEGPNGIRGFKAEKDRYHLVVAYICPWASRTLAVRALKGLEDIISVSVVDPRLTEQGWRFGDFEGSTDADELIGANYVHELYTHANAEISGRATVPILWDKKRQTIVNNESADIVRILNDGFGKLASNDIDLYPTKLHAEIDMLNEQIYDKLNNGVYKAGFASTQKAYEEAVTSVFEQMRALDERLADARKFLFGDFLTETDIRLFVTMIRFDAAYFGLFKCNLAPLAAYPNLLAHTRRIFDMPDVRKTVNFDHIKQGYYSVKALNPNGIVPLGPTTALAA